MSVLLAPMGIYLAREAGPLAGVSGDRIGQWQRRGYIHASQGARRDRLSTNLDPGPNLYSYQDVLEAMAVHEMVLHQVSHRSVLNAVNTLRTLYEDGRWPLSRSDLWLDRAKGMVLLRKDEVNMEISTSKMMGQVRLKDIVPLQKIAGYLSRGGWASRLHPEIEHICVDPEVMSGTPTIRGRRLAAEKVGRIAETSHGRSILRADYKLSPVEISDARLWWSSYGALLAS